MLIFFQELIMLLFLWFLRLIDGIMEIFSAIAGVTDVTVNGQKVNIIEYLVGDSTVETLFWCVFILAVGLTCIFGIAALVKNMIANNRNVSSIIGKIGLALLGTMAILTVVILGILISNSVLTLVAEIFRIGNTTKLSNALFNACVGEWLNGYTMAEIDITSCSVSKILGEYNATAFGIWPTSWKGNGMVNPETFLFLPSMIASIALTIAMVVAIINLAKRVYEIVLLYLVMPVSMSTLPLDDGARFKVWRETFITKIILAYGTVCGIETKILGRRETAIFLKYSYSRNFDEREIKEIDDNRLIEWVKPKTVEFKSNRYTIDGTEASVLAIADYPLRVRNAWGADLFNIPNTKVVMHVKPVDKYKAIKRIDKVIGEMETKQILSEKASEANSAETHRETMHALLDSLQTENESLLDVTLTITAYNYLNDANYKKKARRAMLTGNFKPSMLYGLQVEGFKSADVSPVSSLSNYERGINSSSLAAVFPFVRTFVMDKGGYMLGENKSNHYPFIFNLWKRGNLYQNSNGFIIGKSGSGKSYFLKNLILNEWANDTRIIVLDPEAEYLNVTRSLSGNIIDVGNAKEGRINPFHIYKVLTEDGSVADPVVTFNTHLKMLESFFKIVFGGASVDVIELINNLAVETYERKGITETTDCTNFTPEQFPTFTDMLETLMAKDRDTMDALTLRDMRTAELYLQKFVKGRYSDIWNAPSTLQVDADLIDFNFQSLFANKNNTVANAQMCMTRSYVKSIGISKI